MRTGAQGNDALMVLVPLGALVVAGCIVFGGPAGALDAANAFVGEIASKAVEIVKGLF
jgi:hypothetical protein